MLRSERMTKIALYFRENGLRDCLSFLGDASILQLVNLNPERKADSFDTAAELQAIEKQEQRLQYLYENIIKAGTIPVEGGEPLDYSETCRLLDEYYHGLVDSRHRLADLCKQEQETEENYRMARIAEEFIHRVVDEACSVNFAFTVGIADRSKKFLIKKTLRQRLRRNIFIRTIDVELSHTDKQKTVIVVYVLSIELIKAVQAIFESLNGRILEMAYKELNRGANDSKPTSEAPVGMVPKPASGQQQSGSARVCYDSSSGADSLDDGIAKVMVNDFDRITSDALASATSSDGISNCEATAVHALRPADTQSTAPSQSGSHNLCSLKSRMKLIKKYKISANREINRLITTATEKYSEIKHQIIKQKRLLESVNRLTRGDAGSFFLGEGWILSRREQELKKIRDTMENGLFAFEPVKTDEIHPTHIQTNKFTEAFQGFTNVFGVPKYREINPAIFLIFSFPVMFGAMFGDILHGLLLALLSAYLICRFDRLNHRCGVFQIILEGRYVILACAVSAVWFGLLYGDFGSLPVQLFPSQYDAGSGHRVPGRVYPFGIDPAWHHATNQTVFINSIKMKLSLILGFIHMSIGGLIAIYNATYFRDAIELVCVAVPQFVVFSLFLGYLVFLCVYKWLVTSNRPSLVNTLIGMYTSPFSISPHMRMYPGQMYVQLFILAVIVFCVPWMFLSKPLYLLMRHRVPPEGVLDMWISSGIHVVEFGLGLISNTSSYLRLWAVSLAHVQLTSVLHQFTIGGGNPLVSVCLLPVYLVFTLFLLIGLEGLSACLHALRLNWIEFFSKFYGGGGVQFEPLTFKLAHEEIHTEPLR